MPAAVFVSGADDFRLIQARDPHIRQHASPFDQHLRGDVAGDLVIGPDGR